MHHADSWQNFRRKTGQREVLTTYWGSCGKLVVPIEGTAVDDRSARARKTMWRQWRTLYSVKRTSHRIIDPHGRYPERQVWLSPLSWGSFIATSDWNVSRNAVLKNWLKRIVMQDSDAQNCCWKNTRPVMLPSFGSLMKRYSQWPHQKIHRMTECMLRQHPKRKTLLQNAFFAHDRHSVSHWWCQSACQNWATPIWYLSILEPRSMEPTIVTCCCHNSCYLPYVISWVSFSSFSRTVPSTQGTWDNPPSGTWDAGIYLTRFVAAKQPRPEPSWLQIWGTMQQRVYQTKVEDVDNLKRRLIDVWSDVSQGIIDDAIDQWCKRLHACIRARGGHFEYSLWLFNRFNWFFVN